jgi:hypothetical protein
MEKWRTGHSVLEDTRVGGADVSVEALVKLTDVRPVKVERGNVLLTDAGSEVGLLESGANGTHRRLGGHTGHACMEEGGK